MELRGHRIRGALFGSITFGVVASFALFIYAKATGTGIMEVIHDSWWIYLTGVFIILIQFLALSRTGRPSRGQH